MFSEKDLKRKREELDAKFNPELQPVKFSPKEVFQRPEEVARLKQAFNIAWELARFLDTYRDSARSIPQWLNPKIGNNVYSCVNTYSGDKLRTLGQQEDGVAILAVNADVCEGAVGVFCFPQIVVDFDEHLNARHEGREPFFEISSSGHRDFTIFVSIKGPLYVWKGLLYVFDDSCLNRPIEVDQFYRGKNPKVFERLLLDGGIMKSAFQEAGTARFFEGEKMREEPDKFLEKCRLWILRKGKTIKNIDRENAGVPVSLRTEPSVVPI